MPKFNDIKSAINKAGDLAKKGAASIGDKVKEIDTEKLAESARYASYFVESTVENVQESIASFDSDKAKETITKATQTGLSAIQKHFNNMSETSKAAKEALKTNEENDVSLSVEDSLKILYLLMYSDNKVTDDEIKKFKSVEKELDIDNKIDENALITYCDATIAKSQGDEYIDYLIDEISEIISSSKKNKSGVISKKLFMWNLLALAYSDGEYTEDEKKIIRAVARKLQIEKNIIQEMEMAIQTIISISDTNDLPGSNAEVNNERINVIMNSIYQLIGD